MKKLLIIVFGLVFGMQMYAQRFAIVDSELILLKMPDYKQAKGQLDQFSKKWQAEVEALQKEVEDLKSVYYAEKVLLTEEMQKEQLKRITDKENDARDLQAEYFGPQGAVFKKRQELIRPIQDRIYTAIQEVARRRNLDVVFDKSSDLIMLYDSGDANISDEVLKKLGY